MENKFNIIGIGVCGSGEASRYMRKTMEEFKRLCDDVIICCNNVSEKEIKLIEEFGFHWYEDNREWGIHQPSLKTELLTRADKLKPTHIIALDMDERFAPEFTREEAENLFKNQPNEISFNFFVINLYNDEQHFAHSTGIQRFWNIRFYKWIPEISGYQFIRKNLHCGLAQPLYYKYGWHAPFYLLHYGLMDKEDRIRKAERYQKYDPNKKFKGGTYYDELLADLPMRKFDGEQLLKQLRESPETHPRKRPILPL